MSEKSNVDKKNAIKILDYWFVMEFMNQQSLEVFEKKGDKASTYKKELEAGKRKKSKDVVEDFVHLLPGNTLQTVATAESEGMQLHTWSDFTVFIGRIKKEFCIQKIAQNVEWNGRCPEENDKKKGDEIVLATVKFSKDGKYVPNSLLLSPLAWAMNKMSGGTANASKKWSIDDYNSDKRDVETQIVKLFNCSGNDDVVSEKAELPTNLDSVSYDVLKKNEELICGELNVNEKDMDSYLAVYFKLYESENEDEDEKDAEVVLHMDGYSKDLEFAAKGLQNDLFSKEKEKILIDYVLGLNRYDSIPDEALNRFDIVKPKNEEELYQFMLENLTVAKAPLGKWPSRYMPALMQQIAVNFSTDPSVQWPIFSVNGPPGTGKTTLLKEIIVNNIIQKAILLADYDDSDSAFDDYCFINGSDTDNSYNQFAKRYHRLNNKKINAYSMLVVSSNNTAVENITKEIPVEESLLKSIKPSDTTNDPNEIALAELTQLFTVSESKESIHQYKVWEEYEDKKGEYKRYCKEIVEEQSDIYFSKLATDLINAESENKEKQQAFGLISAALGKASNIAKVETNVIKPLLDIMNLNADVEKRKPNYLLMREMFLEQLSIVQKLGKKIDELFDAEKNVSAMRRRVNEKEQQVEEYQKKKPVRLAEIGDAEQNLIEKKNQLLEEMENLKEKRVVIDNNRAVLEAQIGIQKNSIVASQEKIKTLQNSVSALGRFFKSASYKEIQNQVAQERVMQTQLSQQVTVLNEKLEEEKKQADTLQKKINCLAAEISEISKKLKDLYNKREKIKLEGEELEKKLAEVKVSLGKQKEILEKAKVYYQNQDSYERGFILDRQFISDILSSDNDISTKAQIRNPWFTEHYNREREKLFLYALQMTKEFILSSKKCRDNFKHLHCLWSGGYDKKTQVKFIGEDLQNCTTAAYETLFLLIPVISSTFFSVQRFFKDVREEDIIGTLIVDEAGQASPHMAVGALCRSRKAVIVGDPKQVEPVVSDDQDLLKQTYTDDFFELYKDKTNSVQRFADIVNPYGTYLKNADGDEEWVGCPLIVHRRCGSPMYEISNDISYNNIMKQQTTPPDDRQQDLFIADTSQWFNIRGKEEGNKRHFVKEQGEKVVDMLEIAFSKSSAPDVFIITPFTTVETGIKEFLKKYINECKRNGVDSSLKDQESSIWNWMDKNVGTVHKFQGKEAAEVIFLLGCDTSDNAKTAIQWVNNNIVNVAATRAKYRFYVIGDIDAWKKSKCVNRAKKILDSYVAGSLNYVHKNHNSDDGYTLIITEKPSVAEAYAKALCVWNEKKDFYEGNGYLISWCLGHLVEMAAPEQYNAKYKHWDLKDLPIIPDEWKYQIMDSKDPEGKKRILQRFDALKALMNRNDVTDILCATDAGREGELIFRLVYQQAECKKPIKRIWLSSMEPASIRNAFDNPNPSSDYDSLYEAARCRQLADWMVGMNASRFYTCRYKNEIKKIDKKTLSVGRVVSPTLAMVVEREKEIEEFVPETYYTVNLNIGGLVFKSKHISAEEETVKTFRIVEQKRSKSISSN